MTEEHATEENAASRHDAKWRKALVEAVCTVNAFLLCALAVRLFCWLFFIPFDMRRAVGGILIITAVVTKWLFRKNHR